MRQVENGALTERLTRAAAVSTISTTWLSSSVTKSFFFLSGRESHLTHSVNSDQEYWIWHYSTLIQRTKPEKVGLHIALQMLQSKR